MTILRSLLLFTLAALAEIGGGRLIWRSVREHRVRMSRLGVCA